MQLGTQQHQQPGVIGLAGVSLPEFSADKIAIRAVGRRGKKPAEVKPGRR